MKDRSKQLGEKLAELDALDERRVDAFEDMLEDRPAPAAAGVDLSPVSDAVPGFDGLQFLAVARETYGIMREAWEHHDASIAADLMGVQVAADLAEAIVDDRASHRIHLLPGVEIHEAQITSADVDGAVVRVVTRLDLISREYYANPDGSVRSGDTQYHCWREDWTFEKDTSVDESVEDRVHALLPEARGGWDFAHQGWNVTAIERVA